MVVGCCAGGWCCAVLCIGANGDCDLVVEFDTSVDTLDNPSRQSTIVVGAVLLDLPPFRRASDDLLLFFQPL